MTWLVPLTQMVPLGLRTRWQAASQSAIELMVGVGAAGDVPLAFIDADHAAGVAGDAVVGEEVGRVGEDEVDAGWGDGGEDVEAVALEDFDVVLGVVEDGGGEGPAFAEASAREIGGGLSGGAMGAGLGGLGLCGLWREMRRGFGHGFGLFDDQVGSLIEW